MTTTSAAVLIVDYDMGNLFSVAKALDRLGASYVFSRDPDVVAQAARIILPGVGAFGDAMYNLRQLGLVAPLRQRVAEGCPLLGICLGMQLLFDTGYEFDQHQGLGFIPGEVTRLWAEDANSGHFKLPHIGWNKLRRPLHVSWEGSVLAGLEVDEFAYFVHSFAPVPLKQEYILSETQYGEITFCSTVRMGNVFGCQFHPELSGSPGLHILENFINFPSKA